MKKIVDFKESHECTNYTLHKKVIIFSEINCPAGETPLDNHGRGQSELLQEFFFQSRGWGNVSPL